jgi:hypothetical protein
LLLSSGLSLSILGEDGGVNRSDVAEAATKLSSLSPGPNVTILSIHSLVEGIAKIWELLNL